MRDDPVLSGIAIRVVGINHKIDETYVCMYPICIHTYLYRCMQYTACDFDTRRSVRHIPRVTTAQTISLEHAIASSTPDHETCDLTP
jgi:hypothetical protein